MKGVKSCKLLGPRAGTSQCKSIYYYHHVFCHGYFYYHAGYCWLLVEEPVGASGGTPWWFLFLLTGVEKGRQEQRPQLGMASGLSSSFSIAGLELRLTGLGALVEVTGQGPKSPGVRGCPRRSSGLSSLRGPEQVGCLEEGAAGGNPSHPPCLLLTGGQAGAGCTRCRPSGQWQISPAAGPPHCAAPHLGGLRGTGRQRGASKAVGADKMGPARECKWPANHLPEPEAPRQGREDGTRRGHHPANPGRS